MTAEPSLKDYVDLLDLIHQQAELVKYQSDVIADLILVTQEQKAFIDELLRARE